MEVARRIVGCISANDMVGRLSGDEFIVLVGELGTDRDRAVLLANEIAERILANIKRPMTLDENLRDSFLVG